MYVVNSFLLIVSLISCGNAEEKLLTIDIYYESLCPDSLDFIANQFHPVYDDIDPYVKVNFVPFGKSASINNGAEFACQHGPKECVGNKLQSCALKALKTQDEQVAFVKCFMKMFRKEHDNEQNFANTCLIEGSLEWHFIKTCYDGELGKSLQLEAEQETLRAKAKFIPTIIYNGVFNQTAQDYSLTDFHTTVCNMLAAINPKACKISSVLHL